MGGVSENKKTAFNSFGSEEYVCGRTVNLYINYKFIMFIRIGVSWINNASLKEIKTVFQELIYAYIYVITRIKIIHLSSKISVKKIEKFTESFLYCVDKLQLKKIQYKI